MKLEYLRPVIQCNKLWFGFAWFGLYWIYNRPTKCIVSHLLRGGWFRDMRGQWHKVF